MYMSQVGVTLAMTDSSPSFDALLTIAERDRPSAG